MNEDDRTPLDRLLTLSGRSRRWLAGRLGIDESLVSRYATGDRRMPAETAQEIAEILNVPVEWLRPADTSELETVA